MFLEMYPFLLDYPACWGVIVHSTFLRAFAYQWFQGTSLSFLMMSPLSLNLAETLSALFFSKNQLFADLLFLLVFFKKYVSFCCLFSLYFIYLSSDVFLLLTLDFICSFLFP